MSEKLESLDTPDLVVDLDQMETNLQKVQAFIDSTDRVLRPHTKAHKIPEIAAMQLALGAKGISIMDWDYHTII